MLTFPYSHLVYTIVYLLLLYFRSLVPITDLVSRSHVQYQSVDSVHQPNFFTEQASPNLATRERNNNKKVNDFTPVGRYRSPGRDFTSKVELNISPVGCGVRMDPLYEADSDTEDDPTKLLNQWLGELNTLKKVNH